MNRKQITVGLWLVAGAVAMVVAGRAVVAQLDYNKAVARFEQAIGTTLEQHKIALK